MPNFLVTSPWFWGLCGALIYSAGRLAVSLWGDHPAAGVSIKKAWADFAIGTLSGPIFAEGLGPIIAGHVTAIQAQDGRAIWLAIGLSVNSIQPMVVNWLRTLLGGKSS